MATLYSAKYLIASPEQIFEGGALLEEGGRILEVGPLSLLKKSHPGATLVDYPDAVILPTFINAHTHLELSEYPAWASAAGVSSASCSFVDWILRLIRVKRSIAPNALAGAIEQGLRLSLAAGTAAVGDILSWYEGRSAFVGTPMRGRIYLESLGQDLEVTRQQYKKLSTVLTEQRAGQLEFGISPHSPYTIRPGYMRELYQYCRTADVACATHIAESAAEVDFLVDGAGEFVERLYPAINWHQYLPKARQMRPLEFLAHQGGLFAGQLLIHGVQLQDAEIAAIVAAGARLVLCPRSNEHLQVGTAPVAKLKQAGVSLALGTDSLASNQSLSLWDELVFAAEVYADSFDEIELFTLATREGAAALGLTGELGELKPAFRCSFQVVPLPLAVPGARLLQTLIGAGKGRQLSALILDGQVVKVD